MRNIHSALQSFRPTPAQETYQTRFPGGRLTENLRAYGPAMEGFRDVFARHRLNASMEDADGQAVKEIEHVIYARLSDFSQLEKAASKVFQEQWNLPVKHHDGNAGSGGVRVRKTVVEGAEPTFEVTSKVKIEQDTEVKAAIETTVATTEDMFETFRFLGDAGMIKTRYHFPIIGSELVWEVDCFHKADGSFHEWVKIDLEVASAEDQLPDLPMSFDEVILPEGYGREGDQEERIKGLYRDYFTTPNPYLEGSAKPVQEVDAETSTESDDVDGDSTTPTEENPEPDHQAVEPLPDSDAEIAEVAGLNPDGSKKEEPEDKSKSEEEVPVA